MLHLCGQVSNPKIIEIGCGDGRDANEIIKHTHDYVGFDISEALIELARTNVPEAKFEIADAVTYHYPKDVNVVFAFASLLHLDRDEVAAVMGKVHASLRLKGIFYISLKYAPEYSSSVKEDKFGNRLFYFYNSTLIEELAGKGFVTKMTVQHTIGSTEWFEIALQKIATV